MSSAGRWVHPRAPGPLASFSAQTPGVPTHALSRLSALSTRSSCGAPARPGLTRPALSRRRPPLSTGVRLSGCCRGAGAEATRSMEPHLPTGLPSPGPSPGPLGTVTSPVCQSPWESLPPGHGVHTGLSRRVMSAGPWQGGQGAHPAPLTATILGRWPSALPGGHSPACAPQDRPSPPGPPGAQGPAQLWAAWGLLGLHWLQASFPVLLTLPLGSFPSSRTMGLALCAPLDPSRLLPSAHHCRADSSLLTQRRDASQPHLEGLPRLRAGSAEGRGSPPQGRDG